jgi:copper transport protein
MAMQPSTARAHANLVKSEPAANAVVAAAPAQLVLYFSEEVELRFTEVRVVGARGGPMIAGEPRPQQPGPSSVITVPVTLAGDDTYTVAWRTESAVDGHPTRGVFAFTVGTPPATPVVPLAVADWGGGPPTWLQALGRWLSFLGIAGLLGLAVAAPLLMRRLIRPVPTRRALPWLVLVGTLLVAGALLTLFVQLWTSAGRVSNISAETLTTFLGETRYGTSWLVRAGVTVAGLGAAFVGLRTASRAMLWAAGLLAFALPFTISVNAHVVAEAGNVPGTLIDGLHFVAAGLWIGGLAVLLFGQRREGERLDATAFRRFSPIAIGAVTALVATGVIAWLIVLGDLHATVDSTYGRLVLVKVGLLLPMLALGAVHFSRGRRARSASSAQAAAGGAPRFTLAAEALLGVSVLVAAAWLASTGPPSEGAPAETSSAGTNALIRHADDLDLALQVNPSRPGRNVVTITVRQGAAAGPFERVAVDFTYLDQDIGTTQVLARDTGGGVYVVDGTQLSLPGKWRIDVDIQRPTKQDADASWEIVVGGASDGSNP